jgi:hypothetical protein
VGAARAVHERSPRRSGDGTGWHRCRNIFGAALALGNHTKAGLQAGWQIHSEFPHDADLLSAAGLRAQVCIALHEVGSARPRLRRMRQHCLRLGRNTPGDAILIRARQQPVHALRNSEPKASACTAPCQERLNDRLRGRAFVRIGGPWRVSTREYWSSRYRLGFVLRCASHRWRWRDGRAGKDAWAPANLTSRERSAEH